MRIMTRPRSIFIWGMNSLNGIFSGIEEAFGKGGVTVDISSFNYLRLAGNYLQKLTVDSDGTIVLQPHCFILSNTREEVGNTDPGCCLAARVEGRSSLARLGLQIHMTAPTVHAGWLGNLALEIFNAGPFPLRLSPGTAICQLIIEEVKSPPTGSMEGTQFQGQDSARGKQF